MKRLTKFNPITKTYMLLDHSANLVKALGELEDFKEKHEPQNIGEYLRDLREKLGFTQAKFAYKLDIARTTLIKYETGQCTPKVSVLLRINQYCGVPLADLQKAYRQYVCKFDDEKLDSLLNSDSSDATELYIQIGRLVRFEREFNGYTKGELASILKVSTQKVSTQTISCIEAGKLPRAPTFYILLGAHLRSAKLKEVGSKLHDKLLKSNGFKIT